MQLDSKLNLVPAKLERVDSECDKFKSKYETMLQLKPVREAVSRLFQVALLIVIDKLDCKVHVYVYLLGKQA